MPLCRRSVHCRPGRPNLYKGQRLKLIMTVIYASRHKTFLNPKCTKPIRLAKHKSLSPSLSLYINIMMSSSSSKGAAAYMCVYIYIIYTYIIYTYIYMYIIYIYTHTHTFGYRISPAVFSCISTEATKKRERG